MSLPSAPAITAVDLPPAPAAGLLRRVTAGPVTYAVGYLVLALPTYALPYFGSNSHLLRTTAQMPLAAIIVGVAVGAGTRAGPEGAA